MKVTIDSRWMSSIRGFGDAQRLELYDAIFDYMDGRTPKLSTFNEAPFAMLLPMLGTQKKKKESKLMEVEEFRSELLQKLDTWMEKVTPYIYHNIARLTEKEFQCLLSKYNIAQICDTLQQIENRKDLRKRYTNLYRTLLNWMKTNYGT